ncbi:PREDICTED: uncharacterized protein LOC106741310 [Dinoponera quadriceps]|uniref:Uncharacterized protein LOC106741310 n=1 Tax=Dinoponera quadriceps TaxID=609295 RepID=A0A6P3WS30_DINQU|nr:PREDICTED: uncharacterized protein LOC106741310 [Dinoponera quadriceps]XP_014468618.1 PREDICTED: uncharacterized protein LOC106741310 [Dinoponera quadriceps]XP_014468619.1 PREDICTED: uncharacterized protein LOC106741310 [Dinoponera quadriceps]XP_014468620.1 PREDICTED: uncharacterized protein LOC106741310 [Dinoponera quadriceps]XP_014468621.1 PREDICTED: uncharacterized protein LOC106741310 [Dinoponera quadriceps]XP_014468622.1 PREDICTED: uncharacterized protein LOC106741310 [Dinoponera quadr
MEAMNCEKSDDTVKHPNNTVEEPDNATVPSDNVAEQPDDTVEQPDNIVEQPDNTVGQPDNTVEQPDDTIEQSDNTVEQPDATVEQLDSVVEQPEDTVERMDTTEQNPETSGNVTSHTENKDEPMQVEDDERAKNDSADLVIDIGLDTQLDTHKDVTDEDVMHHLDVIENIELDPETFCMDKSTENDNEVVAIKSEEEEQMQQDEVNGEDKGGVEENWYKKKIADKEALVKERLSKLARVLGITYPHYEKWLERIEKKEGSPMCKLDPFRRCLLDKPHTNRWKFECIRKDVQVTVKEEEKSESSNKSYKTVWSLEPTSAWGVDIHNTSEFPSFVLKAVKIFEDFLQTTITSPDDAATASDENLSNDTSSDVDSVQNQMWMWLLVRCNSMGELMLFATGKNISRSTLDRLKQIYESGQGKDCNVKSLYCKSLNKCANNKIITNTTFLVGAEALDEVVGGLKVQLSPKTNFWSNAAGALNVAKAVMDMLKPTSKVTILEIGCGIGVVGLMMASKCLEVIGVDSPSEIEEAEITCDLNNITNASFIMGSPADVVNKISAAVKNRVTYAIVNANTNMGRAVEVMTCLRKLTSLRRIVMVTTLTKQSVRAVLELARPIEDGLGHPFMPTRACVVDTLPIGPHFEAVILMEHRLMHRLTQPWFLKILEEESKSLENTRALEKEINSSSLDSVDTQLRKNPLASVGAAKKSKTTPTKKTSPAKSGSSSPTKSKMRLKRENESPEIIEIPKKMTKKYDKPGYNKSWKQQDATAKKKNWPHNKSTLRVNPLYDKKSKDKDQVDLRAKLSSNRIDTDLVQKVNESREILEAAKEKLSGPSPTVDATTAKELQNVLSLVLEQTNKLQNQLPRSVWDRIAPPETSQSAGQVKKELDDDPLLKGRFVQETHAQDIVITTANKEYLDTDNDVKPALPYRKYHNLPPLEPDILPVSLRNEDGKTKFYERPLYNRNRQQNQGNSWNRNNNNKGFQKNRWGNAGGGNARKPNSPIRKQNSPFRHRGSPPRRSSPKRSLQSPPRRPASPPRRRLSSDRPVSSPSQSPYQGRNSHMHREFSPQRRPVPLMPASSAGRRDMSPRRSFSPSNRAMSPSRRPMSPPRRPMSPVQQMSPSWRPLSLSPPRRQMSPMRMYGSSTRQMSPMRRPVSPMRHRPMSPVRQMSPQRRAMSPVGRMMSPSRSRGVMPPRHQSPMRRPSPHRMPPGHEFPSPTRRQSPPQNRFTDEWDIPNLGAVEQGNTWQRPVNERPSENVWRNERQPTTSGNQWQPLSDNNDRYRKSQNQQDRSWNNRDSASHGSSWGSKQPFVKPGVKEPWNQNSDNNRWSGPARSGNNNDNWNNRGKDSMAGGREEAWMDSDVPRWEQPQSNDSWNQGDKEDWHDLPEDARDPWGDDGNLELKDRWMNVDNQVVLPSNWSRDTDKGDSWSKPKDSWQNKSQAFSSKPPCQGSGNPNDSRWLAPNDLNKKAPSTNWQGGGNSGTWQQSSGYNFQSQRPFNTSVFKDRR